MVVLRLRRLPLESEHIAASGDQALIALAQRSGLTAYDAAYLLLARNRGLPLATLRPGAASSRRGGRRRTGLRDRHRLAPLLSIDTALPKEKGRGALAAPSTAACE